MATNLKSSTVANPTSPNNSLSAINSNVSVDIGNYGKLVRDWLCGLTRNERISLIALDDRDTCRLILAMYSKQLDRGYGYYYGVNDICLEHMTDFSGKPKVHRHHHVKPSGNNSTANNNSLCTDSDCSYSRFLAPSYEYDKSISHTQPLQNPSELSLTELSRKFGFLSEGKVPKIYHSEPAIRAVEIELQSKIRLTDTREYCDTLTVSLDLLENGEKFLTMMDIITKNKFLSAPCYVQWDNQSKYWLWDIPAWFKGMGFYSLARYIAHKLEMIVWARYWESKHIDPRKIPQGKIYSVNGLVRERLSSKLPLEQYWANLNRDRRDKILLKLSSVVEMVRKSAPFISETESNASDLSYTEELNSNNDSLSSTTELALNNLDTHSHSNINTFNHPNDESGVSNSAPIQLPATRSRSRSLPRRSADESALSAHHPTTPTALIRSRPILLNSFSATTSPWSSLASSLSASLHTSPYQSPVLSPTNLRARSHSSHSPSLLDDESSAQESNAASCSNLSKTPLSEKERRKAKRVRERETRRKANSSWGGTNRSEPVEANNSAPVTDNSSTDNANFPKSSSSSILLVDRHEYQTGLDHLLRILDSVGHVRGSKSHMQALNKYKAASNKAAPNSANNTNYNAIPHNPECSGAEATMQRLGRSESSSDSREIRQRGWLNRAALEDLAAEAEKKQRSLPNSPVFTSINHAEVLGNTENSVSPLILSPVLHRVASLPNSSWNSADSRTYNPTNCAPSSANHAHSSSTTRSTSYSTGSNSISSSLGSDSSLPGESSVLDETKSESDCSAVPLPNPSDLSAANFIEFLFFSPLSRAHSSLDLIVRRMGIILQGSYAEQMGMDLITSEEAEENQEDNGCSGGNKAQSGEKKKAAASAVAKKKKAKLKKKAEEIKLKEEEKQRLEEEIRKKSAAAAVAAEKAADSSRKQQNLAEEDAQSSLNSNSTATNSWTQVTKAKAKPKSNLHRAKDDFFTAAESLPRSAASQPPKQVNFDLNNGGNNGAPPKKLRPRAKDDSFTQKSKQNSGPNERPKLRQSIQFNPPLFKHPPETIPEEIQSEGSAADSGTGASNAAKKEQPPEANAATAEGDSWPTLNEAAQSAAKQSLTPAAISCTAAPPADSSHISVADNIPLLRSSSAGGNNSTIMGSSLLPLLPRGYVYGGDDVSLTAWQQKQQARQLYAKQLSTAALNIKPGQSVWRKDKDITSAGIHSAAINLKGIPDLSLNGGLRRPRSNSQGGLFTAADEQPLNNINSGATAVATVLANNSGSINGLTNAPRQTRSMEKNPLNVFLAPNINGNNSANSAASNSNHPSPIQSCVSPSLHLLSASSSASPRITSTQPVNINPAAPGANFPITSLLPSLLPSVRMPSYNTPGQRYAKGTDSLDDTSEQKRSLSHHNSINFSIQKYKAWAPWLSSRAIQLLSFGSKPSNIVSSISSCHICQELAEKAKAGARQPAVESGSNNSQQVSLMMGGQAIPVIPAAHSTAPPVMPNFLVTPGNRGSVSATQPSPSSTATGTNLNLNPALGPHHPHQHNHNDQSIDTVKLHREIQLFTSYVTNCTNSRQSVMFSVLERIRACVLSIWPHAVVNSYGSFMTGLCLPSSDLDLVIMNVVGNKRQALQQLAGLLRKQKSWLTSLNAIETAKVPVIKANGVLDGKEVMLDITFDSSQDSVPSTPLLAPQQPNQLASNSNPPSPDILIDTRNRSQSNPPPVIWQQNDLDLPPNALLNLENNSQPTPPPLPGVVAHTGLASVELLCHYVAVFPALRPLALVLKQYLYEKSLANTYTGGLNSYCLVLMLVSFLQSKPNPYHEYYRQQHSTLQSLHQQHFIRQIFPNSDYGQPHNNGNTGISPDPPLEYFNSSNNNNQAAARDCRRTKSTEFRGNLPPELNRPNSLPPEAHQQPLEPPEQLNNMNNSKNNGSPVHRARSATAVGLTNPVMQSKLNPHTPEFSPAASQLLADNFSLNNSANLHSYSRTTPSTPVKFASCSTIPSNFSASAHKQSFSEPELADLELGVEEQDLGALLLEFLEWFGVQFDFQTMGISVAPPPTLLHLPNYLAAAAETEFFQQHGFTPITMPPVSPYAAINPVIEAPPIHGCFFQLPIFSRTLVISDPFYPLMVNNIGKSVFAMWRIKMAFAEALQIIKQRSSTAPTLLSRLIHGQHMSNNPNQSFVPPQPAMNFNRAGEL
jgi:hypothetical protein